MSAAVALLRADFGVNSPVVVSLGSSTKSDRLHPYLAEILASRRLWKQPQAKKEPLSGAILDCMHSLASLACTSSKQQGWLSRDAVLYDFCQLGLFTGSQLAEFGQSGLPAGSALDA